MSILTAKKFKSLNQELLDKTEELPLYSKEVVEVSQKLDLFVVQAMKKQIQRNA